MRIIHTIEEAAERLRLHPQTVYRKCWAGKIGSEKHGSKRFIPDECLLAYEKANFQPAESGPAEIEAAAA